MVLYKLLTISTHKRAIAGRDTTKIYLIAANDGQLVEAWAGEIVGVGDVRQVIEDLLVEEMREKEGFSLRLYNLSRQSAAVIFPRILDAVLKHPGWGGCERCSQQNLGCPIWENKLRLERSGTLNVPGIVGLGEACRLRQLEMEEDEKAIAHLRDKLQTLLLGKIPGLVINGDITSRLSGNLHISIPDIPNSAIIARVCSQLAISTGSACSSGVETPSHVLVALGLPDNVIEGALRIGIGKFTTESEIVQAAEILSTAVSQTRQAMSLHA